MVEEKLLLLVMSKLTNIRCFKDKQLSLCESNNKAWMTATISEVDLNEREREQQNDCTGS